jgi:N-acetylglucosaminyl-diphospho-decaprenol L-rhamnosyltransferase
VVTDRKAGVPAPSAVYARRMAFADVVVVSYNSRETLRECVEPLASGEGIDVFVVDSASQDGSLDAVADLDVVAVQLSWNGGFAHGCNAGWRLGSAPFVLLLNPDARLDVRSLRTLAAALERDGRLGAAAPRIVGADGALALSQRRFPRLRSTYAQALFLHRLFPRAAWADEPVSDEHAYAVPGEPHWVSGACVLVRRSALERLNGLDAGFFLYCEDIDLCRRLRAAGYGIRYEPEAVAEHVGGASTPDELMLPVLAASRIRYARKHRGRAYALLERLGVALGAATHALAARDAAARRGHVRALRTALRGSSALPERPGVSGRTGVEAAQVAR